MSDLDFCMAELDSNDNRLREFEVIIDYLEYVAAARPSEEADRNLLQTKRALHALLNPHDVLEWDGAKPVLTNTAEFTLRLTQ